MINWFAKITGIDDAHSGLALENAGFGVTAQDGDLFLGVEQSVARLDIATIRAAMDAVGEAAFPANASLIWTFSQVTIPVGHVRGVLENWELADVPPVLSIVRLILGRTEHRTEGMSLFTGGELGARFSDGRSSRDAARNLARLARYALENELDRERVYEGVDRRPLRLEWSADTSASVMVTIIL